MTSRIPEDATRKDEVRTFQAALHESEAKLKSLFNSMNEGVCLHEIIYDGNGNPIDYEILDVNPAFERLIGIPKDAALNRKASKLYGTGEPPYLDIYSRVAETGRFETFDIFWPPLKKHFLVSVFSPQQGRFGTVFTDISDNKEKENLLRESEQYLSTTLNSIGDAVITADTLGRVVRMNPVAEELTGWKLSEAKNKRLDIIFDIENQKTRKKVENPVYKVLKEGLIVGLANHTVLKSKDGNEYFIDDSAAPIKDSTGDVIGVVLIFRDITEKYKSEEKIRRSEERYRAILQTTTAGFWITDSQGWLLEANDAYCRMSGYSMEELLTLGITDLEACEDAEETFAHIKKIREQGHDQFESRHRRKDGSVYDVEVTTQHMPDHGGQFVVFLRDISDRKEHESEREVTIHLMQLLHRENDFKSLLQDVTALMKNWSGCEAVGIRLQDGDDYPYFETRGFPPTFVEAERRLCARDDSGEPIRDAAGNPVLECMCGNVICGRFNPDLPFFTNSGSFWTNSTTDLLASTSEAERQARTRNRCHGEGYESVALIPLRAGALRLGLLQFNDFRRNRFDQRKIALLESLASNLAIGLLQRQTALSLRDSEEKFRLAFSASPDAVAVNRLRDGLYVEINGGFTRLLGFTKKDVAGRTSLDINAWHDPADRQRLVRELEEHGFCENLEARFRRKDGSLTTGLLSARRITLNDEPHIISITRDISEFKKAAAERERLLFAINQAQEIVAITDVFGTIEHVNPAFEKITGYSLMEALGKNPRFLKSGDHDLSFYQNLWETILSGNPWTGRIVNKRKDGSLYTGECSISPIRDKDGDIVNFIWISRDISELIELETRVAQAQKMESIGVLAGGIAHDFNNILFPIIGLAEMLLEDLPRESMEYENADEIHKAARRAGDLVKQILTFGRQSEHIKTPARIQMILKEALKLMRASIPSNIEIHSEMQHDCGLVMADPTQVHQIAMNLTTNAFHAVEQTGGEISVKLTETELNKEEVQGMSLEPGNYAMLSVSDSGHGIQPENLKKIFEPYFTTKGQGKGTGLGLSVVFGIIKGHGGDIQVHSEVGKGTTFDVFFPLMEKTAELAPSEVVAGIETGSESILLVDDEPGVVRLETQMLERLGYRVTSRTSSGDALEAFRANPNGFDLVLSDMAMPHMTGIQLAGELVKIRPDIPIIICTGFSEKLTEQKAKTFGIKGLLMKPVARHEMARLVRKTLDGMLK